MKGLYGSKGLGLGIMMDTSNIFFVNLHQLYLKNGNNTSLYRRAKMKRSTDKKALKTSEVVMGT